MKEREGKKQKRWKRIRGYLHDIGKLFVDVSKLAFGSLVLGTVIRWEIPHTTIFIVGVVFFTVAAIGGIILVRTYKDE